MILRLVHSVHASASFCFMPRRADRQTIAKCGQRRELEQRVRRALILGSFMCSHESPEERDVFVGQEHLRVTHSLTLRGSDSW